MLAIEQVQPLLSPNVKIYTGGRYAYAKWQMVNEQRVPHRCYVDAQPDLQSTYLYNPDGSEALRYIMFDLDVKRADEFWLDEFGAIDWPKVKQHLSAEHSQLFQTVEYVTRSSSGKGIHILIGLAPLPLISATFRAQILSRLIQNDVIRIFNELGLGADEAAIGLKRYFSTYRGENKLLYHNRFLTNRIEKSAKNKKGAQENFLKIFREACNVSIEKLYLDVRLYDDLRLEVKLAKLFLFCCGLYDSEKQKAEPKIHSGLLPDNPFRLSVTLTLDEIAQIMETKKKNLYKSFWEKEEIKKLFHIEKNLDGFEISINVDGAQLEALKKRALRIYKFTPGSSSLHVFLSEPTEILDGMRNASITSWAITLKWHGVEENIALAQLVTLSRQIPNYESSASCRISQLKATIRSVYRNHKEKFGIKDFDQLPEWLKPNIVGQELIVTINNSCQFYFLEGETQCVLGTGQLGEWNTLPLINPHFQLKDEAVRSCKSSTAAAILNSGYPLNPSRSNPASQELGFTKDFDASPIKLFKNKMFDGDIILLKSVKVRSDGYVCFDRKHYSVGLIYKGLKVECFADDKFIYFYLEKRLIEVHERIFLRHKSVSTKSYHVRDYEDVFEDFYYYLEKAQRIGLECYMFISAVMASNFGFIDTRLICSILNLNKKYDSKVLDFACGKALLNGVLSYRVVKSFAENF